MNGGVAHVVTVSLSFTASSPEGLEEEEEEEEEDKMIGIAISLSFFLFALLVCFVILVWFGWKHRSHYSCTTNSNWIRLNVSIDLFLTATTLGWSLIQVDIGFYHLLFIFCLHSLLYLLVGWFFKILFFNDLRCCC